jgi:hypothetical protein
MTLTDTIEEIRQHADAVYRVAKMQGNLLKWRGALVAEIMRVETAGLNASMAERGCWENCRMARAHLFRAENALNAHDLMTGFNELFAAWSLLYIGERGGERVQPERVWHATQEGEI